MNFLKKIIGTTATDEVALIPSGKLFLTRSPQSPKGERECLYNDAFASIRQTTTPFYYQLCIVKAYQEGELLGNGSHDFDDSDGEEDEEENVNNEEGLNNKDEWTFTISEELKLYYNTKPDGLTAISWNDMNGDIGDKFEFVIDGDVKINEVNNFILCLFKSIYEQKYQTSSLGINNMEQLQEFIYDPKLEQAQFDELKTLHNKSNYSDDYYEDESEAEGEVESDEEFHDATEFSDAPEVKGKTVYEFKNFDLHLYVPDSTTFVLNTPKDKTWAKIIEAEKWKYYMIVKIPNGYLNAPIDLSLCQLFDEKFVSFVFNYFVVSSDNKVSSQSWLLKFDTLEQLKEVKEVVSRYLWQGLNRKELGESYTDADKEYLIDAFSRLALNNTETENSSEEENSNSDEEEDDESKMDILINSNIRDKSTRKLFVDEYDEDDEYGDYEDERNYETNFKGKKDKNSSLTVGIANDRSFVTRGEKLGVFSNRQDGIRYETTIASLKNSKGKSLVPKNLVLHQRDQFMVLQDDIPLQNKLYKADLEYGKVVEEWDVEGSGVDVITSFAPSSKFSQLTSEATMLGTGSNSMFRIDPRMSGSKIVQDDTFKSYKTKNIGLRHIATTQGGQIAIGSDLGEIRLYNKLGKNAKTVLPSIGSKQVGINVSKDGEWLLVTYESFLTLICTSIPDGQKNSGSLGFDKFFDADKKPAPIHITIKPEHFAQMAMETGSTKMSFTKAYFDTSITAKETAIVTSTGPYVISWSLRDIIKRKDPTMCYSVERHQNTIIAENFKFESHNDVIVASEDNVSLSHRAAFDKVTKSKLGKNYRRFNK